MSGEQVQLFSEETDAVQTASTGDETLNVSLLSDDEGRAGVLRVERRKVHVSTF